MRARRLLAFAAIYLLWGGAYLAIRLVVCVVPPFLAASIRYSLSATLLLTVSFCGLHHSLPTRRQAINAIATGVAMFAFTYSAIYWAETRIPSWLVAILSSAGFLFTYLGECFVYRSEELRLRALVPVAAGIVGLVFVAGVPVSAKSISFAVAPMVVLGATLLWSLMTIGVQRLSLPASSVQTAGMQLGAAAVVLLVISNTLGEWQRCPAFDVILQPGPILGMIYLVLGGSTAFSAFHWLLRRESPSLVATSTYVNPIVAMLAGIVLFHEQYSRPQLAGAATVLISVVLLWKTRAVTNRSPLPVSQTAAASGSGSIQ